jgi:uncharacterized protein YndB with AHSA1/START domain
MSEDRVLIIKRVLAAPRDLVFAAWTNQEEAARWWGPKGFASIACTMDVRVGGTWRRTMRSPDGVESCARGVYQEIIRPERLVFTYAWEHSPNHPSHETVVTLTFADLGDGKTELTLHQALFETAAKCDDHRAGWSGCLERCAEHLAR